MSLEGAGGHGAGGGDGARTGATGTPLGVDVSGDVRRRVIWAVFLSGPVIWIVHFMLVYLVVEAGCTGEGPGLDLFDPPVSHVVTLLLTAVAAVGCLASASWAYRRWSERESESRADAGGDDPAAADEREVTTSLPFAGLLLSSLSFVAILLVGLPALVLGGC